MINLNDAPEKGMIYALYTDQVIYGVYDRENVKDELNEKELLELHIFDEAREYRVIKSETGMITCSVDDSCPHDDIYEETIFTQNGHKVTVVNYICYDENDLLNIRNYRLKEAE